MTDSVIAIKIADGSYYPVLVPPNHKHRKLVLTTVKDNQSSMKIDLFRGSDEEMSDAQYVGSIFFEKMFEGKKGEPDVELELGFDHEGNIAATATDLASGDMESLSVSNDPESGIFSSPDFAIGDQLDESASGYDEEEPVSAQNRQTQQPSIRLILISSAAFLAVVAIVLFMIFALKGQNLPALGSDKTGVPVVVPKEDTAVKEPVKEESKPAEEVKTPAVIQKELYHDIVRGDTLWDLSNFYYRTPWAWAVIYGANLDRLKNPNILYPGTKLVIPMQ